MQRQLPFSTATVQFELPPVFAVNERQGRSVIQQLLLEGCFREMTVEHYSNSGARGYILCDTEDDDEIILAVSNRAQQPQAFAKVLRVQAREISDGAYVPLSESKAIWECHPAFTEIPTSPIDYKALNERILTSWRDAFNYRREDLTKNIEGLRRPQIGALHAVHKHWCLTDQPATVVMPTGTGKTETMLSVLVSMSCQRLLVVVPTDALRTQIADKFLTLGLLKRIGVLSNHALLPIVGVLKHRPKSVNEVDNFFEKCHVIVTTMSVAGLCDDDVQERMAHHCPFLFIDEAHHLGARSWSKFKEKFASARILQFTATPYREDGKFIEGEIIFNYPLEKAQEDGYFKPIRFHRVLEYDPERRDQVIAEKAVEQLRADQRFGHILMARVDSIRRAQEVFSLYEQYKEFNPVQIHTGLKKSEREEIRQKILRGEARIVVCVDMLGEGFDLPELKIAAFHDIRKSLPVTLQLVGRFIRARSDLGDATIIANVADVEVKEELRKLYIQDQDWNLLLPQVSQAAVEEEIALWEFLEGFEKFPEEVPLQNIRPAMSTVVYKTRCQNWMPDNFRVGIKGFDALDQIYYDVNPHLNVLVVVTARKTAIGWAQTENIFTLAWELYIVFWDQQQALLFIHGSSNSGHYKDLAKAVAGEHAEQIRGPHVFRCFSGVNRLRLQNVGLLEQLGRLIRYTMRAGSDVEPGLTEAQRRNTRKSNIFGAGFEDGRKTTIGCSYKGRIWSRRTTSVRAFTEWCRAIGRKLLDDTIDPDEVLRGTIVPIRVSERPTKMPICIEWPVLFYLQPETAFEFILNGKSVLPLYLADIVLVNPTKEGELRFAIRSDEIDETGVEFVLNLFEKNGITDYHISETGRGTSCIRSGASEISLTEFFDEYPPLIRFADGSSLEEGNSYVELRKDFDPYLPEKIKMWDWTGVDIQKEVQGPRKAADSIQHRVISELKKKEYDIIFDDHGSGEAADVVAIEVQDAAIKVEFYHLKKSLEEKPGGRIDDLYDVCGQAQKSVQWMEKPTELFAHCLRREVKRKRRQGVSRFELGNERSLITLQEMSRSVRIHLDIYIVQPGLSRERVSQDQLELLSVTENYLMETRKVPFSVIANN